MIPYFDLAQLREIAELISSRKKIVIIPHAKPDGDAMGSSLALYNFLLQKEQDVKVVSPSEYPDFLKWMNGNDKVVNFEKNEQEAIKTVKEAELIFCLDFNSPDRVDKLEQYLMASTAKKIMIDHHLAPQNFCDYIFSFVESCATCELIYHFIVQMDGKKYFNQAIAECLYAGIMTDTGSFRFSSMSADTHRIIAEMIESGASNSKIYERIFDNFSETRTRFLGYCLKDKLTVLNEFNTAYIAISKAELSRYNHLAGDTEGIVNYALGIKGIRFSALFSEKEGLIKISFRSRDDFSVKEIANKYFDGGGHKNAAGGRSKLTLEETVKKFVKLLPTYREELTK